MKFLTVLLSVLICVSAYAGKEGSGGAGKFRVEEKRDAGRMSEKWLKQKPMLSEPRRVKRPLTDKRHQQPLTLEELKGIYGEMSCKGLRQSFEPLSSLVSFGKGGAITKKRSKKRQKSRLTAAQKNLIIVRSYKEKKCVEDFGPLTLVAKDVKEGICEGAYKGSAAGKYEIIVRENLEFEPEAPRIQIIDDLMKFWIKKLETQEASYSHCVVLKKFLEKQMAYEKPVFENTSSSITYYMHFNGKCREQHRLLLFSDDAELNNYCAKIDRDKALLPTADHGAYPPRDGDADIDADATGRVD